MLRVKKTRHRPGFLYAKRLERVAIGLALVDEAESREMQSGEEMLLEKEVARKMVLEPEQR